MEVVQNEAASRTRLLELEPPGCPACRSEGGFWVEGSFEPCPECEQPDDDGL